MGDPDFMNWSDNLLLRLSVIGVASLGAAVYSSVAILRTVYWDVPTFRVIAAHFVVFFLISLAVSFIATAIRPTLAAAIISGLVSTFVLFFAFGARPAGVPTLSEFVDRGCLPRATLLIFAVSYPTRFWTEVGFLAGRALEFRSQCAFLSDQTERQDCLEADAVYTAALEYCRRHAERQLVWHGSTPAN